MHLGVIGFAVLTCAFFSGDALAQRPRVVPPGANRSDSTQLLPATPPAPKAGPAGRAELANGEQAKDGPALIAVLTFVATRDGVMSKAVPDSASPAWR